MTRLPAYLTAATLTGIAGLHAAWGRGSSFPFTSRAELADAVVGADDVPLPAACNAVAGALLVATVVTLDLPIGPPRLRSLGRFAVVAILALRGLLGLAGRTDIVSPGSSSPRFRRLDRRWYAPLTLALAAGALSAGRDR